MFESLYKNTFDHVVASENTVQEVLNMKNKQAHNIRIPTLAVAILLICVLATTAFAYAGYVVYENPREMMMSLLGGDASDEGRIYTDKVGQIMIERAFQREPLNEEAVKEYVEPYVYEVGQSITAGGSTLSVDAFTYDTNTQCGLIYMRLENPEGISGYSLTNSGMVIWHGGNQILENLGLAYYIVPEASTETCMTLAGYFYKWDDLDEVLTLQLGVITPNLNQEAYEWPTYIEPSEEILRITLPTTPSMEYITLGNMGIVLSPIGIAVSGDKLDILIEDKDMSVDSVVIRYVDGTEYVVYDGSVEIPIANYAYGTRETGTEEGQRNCVTYVLNRIVSLDKVSEVIVNGVAYCVD